MPLIDFFNIDNYTKIVIWEVSEENNILLKYLKLDDKSFIQYNSLSEKKKRIFRGKSML